MWRSISSGSEEESSVLSKCEDETEVVFPKMKVYENVLTRETALGREIITDVDVRDKVAANKDRSPNTGVNKVELGKASGSVCRNANETFGMSDTKDPLERDDNSDDIFYEVDFEYGRQQLPNRLPIYGRSDRGHCSREPALIELDLGAHCSNHPQSEDVLRNIEMDYGFPFDTGSSVRKLVVRDNRNRNWSRRIANFARITRARVRRFFSS
ncbi:hypothetical protein CDAR_8061 [Caerostris darwini]|uniref:Uncharacterized protein n=1 Tax=Caerostris darwini TaxID=1538125 RepID=A0AAV4Q795_9ARAC|nr:hypothetical protein CDAR_8061 [Caerostris darwini]